MVLLREALAGAGPALLPVPALLPIPGVAGGTTGGTTGGTAVSSPLKTSGTSTFKEPSLTW